MAHAEVQALQPIQEQLRLAIAAENDWTGMKRNKRMLCCTIGGVPDDHVCLALLTLLVALPGACMQAWLPHDVGSHQHA